METSVLTEWIPQVWHMPVKIAVILLGTVICGTITSKLFTAYIRKAKEEEGNDLTGIIFLRRALVVLIYIAGISFAIYMVPAFRIIGSSLLAGAGLLAVVVGFASQQALSNIIGGIFIVIFKPYRINDRLNLQTTLSGVVEDINLRHTVIRNFENKRIIIPNSVISNEILVNSNYQDDLICKFVDLGISYDSDIDKARAIIKEEVLKHPNFIDNRSDEQKANGDELVPVRVLSMTDFSVNLRAWTWAADPPSAFIMGCDLLESIKKRFDAEGIEIPFPYRTIVYKKDLEDSAGNPVSPDSPPEHM